MSHLHVRFPAKKAVAGKSRPENLYSHLYRRPNCREEIVHDQHGAHAVLGRQMKRGKALRLRVHGDQGPGFQATLSGVDPSMSRKHKYNYKNDLRVQVNLCMPPALFPSSSPHNRSNSQKVHIDDQYAHSTDHIRSTQTRIPSLPPIQMAALYYNPTSSGRWHSTKEERRDTMEAANDLLGVRVPLESARASTAQAMPYDGQQVRTVEIRGKPYRVPSRVNKEFYRDLTYLEDDEIIRKYRLEPCRVEDYRAGQRGSVDSRRNTTSLDSKRTTESRRRSRHA